jgi:hypothetical protein
LTDFESTITRAKFEDINNATFQKTLEPVRNVLKDAKIDKSKVDDIVLVGGSTLEEYLDRSIIPEALDLWSFLEHHKPSLVKVTPLALDHASSPQDE